jgi:hypothetical protein
MGVSRDTSVSKRKSYFLSLQKICTLVCKTWFEDIRGDVRLSGQLSLKNDEMEEEEVKTILSNWEKLKILRLSKSLDHLDLSKTHKFLTKVIIPKRWDIGKKFMQ